MLRTILVDDEVSCTDILHWQLETYCPEVKVEAICNSAAEALEKIPELKPDFVFMDIEMPGMNAFELLSRLKPLSFPVIFITAYNQFALQAFKENAVDYLLKPIEKFDLIAAVDKVRQRAGRVETGKMDQLISLFTEQLSTTRKIALPTSDGVSFVNVDQIVRCESDSNYTYIFLQSGEKIVITKTLKQIEESLADYPFYRVHQSHLVNLNHIVKFARDSGGYLIMSDKSNITVARQRKDGLMELFSRL
ncbi:MAG: LytTR family DNA-binding domain-containing protein [Bacteroidia bacterium]